MKKFGIALAGGGARGAYQIGVWKALREHGLDKYISSSVNINNPKPVCNNNNHLNPGIKRGSG